MTAGFSFSGATTYTFTPGSYLRLPIVFNATSSGTINGDLVLRHNAVGLTNVVRLVGTAMLLTTKLASPLLEMTNEMFVAVPTVVNGNETASPLESSFVPNKYV